MKKLLLTLSLIIGITTVSFGQESEILKFRIVGVQVSYLGNNGWDEWSPTNNNTDLGVVSNGRITIYSKEKQVYDVVRIIQDKMTNSDNVSSVIWSCIDKIGTECTVLMVVDNDTYVGMDNWLVIQYKSIRLKYLWKFID